LAVEASYYGFLAADYLQRPYVICQKGSAVTSADLDRFRERPVILRVDALRRAGMNNWARGEWNLNLKSWTSEDRRLAAALATEEGHPELAIWALNSKDDRSYYDLRFPLVFVNQVTEQAGKRKLDTAWVMGLIRTESAMAADAISAANARGLMQVLPGTAAQLAHRYGYAWRGKEQLLQAEDNIVFGTSFLRELMDRFGNNPVLVTGAYNAGPSAVKKWVATLPARDAAIWIETLPFHETRDYIPRVLAFATIYDWRLQKPVRRISSRMPGLDSSSMGGGSGTAAVAAVACPETDAVAMSEAH
ncbi:MAG: transglycosylase SLT domain-containing protein, partial [Lysobacterales bacterium]